MDLRVWVDDWQMQCCGDPFMTGSRVRWRLVAPDREWLAAVLGDRASSVTHAEEHHSRPDDTPVTDADVRGIWAVHYRLAPEEGESTNVLHPVPGTAVLVPVTRATGYEPGVDGRHFGGYLVDLQV